MPAMATTMTDLGIPRKTTDGLLFGSIRFRSRFVATSRTSRAHALRPWM
jgi:hypothetical protein